MDLKPVKSSNIHSVGYENGDLHVKFRSGKRYTYSGVPEELHGKLMAAESKGGFFGKHIRPHYKGQLVEEKEK